jgi:uncharacterized phage protein gp47/JayE
LLPEPYRPPVVNSANGTLLFIRYDLTDAVQETTTQYSGTNLPGSEISEIIENIDGTSLLYENNPIASVTETVSDYSGNNATAAQISHGQDTV